MVQSTKGSQPPVPLTESLFPGTRSFLQDRAFIKALEYLAPKEVLATYKDPIDFLFCELQPAYRDLCRIYYDGKGRELRDHFIATPERIQKWDTLLMGALLLADEIHRQGKSVSWKTFRAFVHETVEGALT